MIVATESEMRNFLCAHTELRCEGTGLAFANEGAMSIRIDLRVEEPHHLAYLARLVAHIGYEEVHFRGAYLWITGWDIWDPLVEAIGLKTLERFRRSYGESRSLESAQGHIFRHDELAESVCCLLQPMLVGWDAYYVPHWAYGQIDYFVAVSHDSFMDIQARTPEMYDKALEVLKSYKWLKGKVSSRTEPEC